jgi:[ribosomal protein S5]-alanine N-acetyltransferase
MEKNILTVRELTQTDIPLLLGYWFNADTIYLESMGVDVTKLPNPDDFAAGLNAQLSLPYSAKKVYALIWELNGSPIGHSNLNPVEYGNEAYMHLHIWQPNKRYSGMGAELVKLSLPFYFDNMKLKKIYCQPYALNPAPHRVLQKAGFNFVKQYTTVPGYIAFEQPVILWQKTI